MAKLFIYQPGSKHQESQLEKETLDFKALKGMPVVQPHRTITGMRPHVDEERSEDGRIIVLLWQSIAQTVGVESEEKTR